MVRKVCGRCLAVCHRVPTRLLLVLLGGAGADALSSLELGTKAWPEPAQPQALMTLVASAAGVAPQAQSPTEWVFAGP